MGAIQHYAFAKFIPNFSEKTDNLRQLLKKGAKRDWTEERNSDFNKIKQKLASLPCLAHYNGNKESIVTTDACNTGLGRGFMAKTRKRGNETHCIRQSLLKPRGKKRFNRRIGITGRSLGIIEIRVYLYGKQAQLFSEHQALEPLLTRNKANKQYNTRLTRYLDRLNHFDISLKHTTRKQIKFTDIISQNPTEELEPEKKYEEEFVIKAIAQLATLNARIGQIFNQSEAENTVSEVNMHDTCTLIDTQRCQTIKSEISSISYILQPLVVNTIVNYTTMNNNDNQNARFFRTDVQLRDQMVK